jgi:hypothetical protein
MTKRATYGFLIVLVACVLAGVALAWYTQQRIVRCAYVPLIAEEQLPNADMSLPGDPPSLPRGWSAGAPGVQLGAFAVDGDGRALQLMGIANYVQTPPVRVEAGQSYCFRGMAITDTRQDAAARLRVTFRWRDAEGQPIAEERTDWQPTVLWQPDAPPASWAPIEAAFRAPSGARELLVRVAPSSDDRIYLDALHIRRGGTPPEAAETAPTAVEVLPWPDGQRAALSFSFDWETTMGGLVHSRSVNDPNFDDDPVRRGLRMREGITTTLNIFRPHSVRATYYATGYNFLMGNTQRVQFMGNPTYTWANTNNHWTSDRWQTMPWFAPDPYGTVQSHPAWYFGDLVPQLQQAQQDIQSHTFSHFYGGFVGAADWRDDFAAWQAVAAPRGVAPARSLAFPWSGSGGMSEANWQVLKEAGITSVTRTSEQSQFNLFPRDAPGLIREPFCRSLPGHKAILACPDMYLTPARVERVIAQIDHALEVGGMIDVWAHTEEVVTPEQRAAWERVVSYAAAQPGLWIAPLREITDWQHARGEVQVERMSYNEAADEPVVFRVTNPLPGLTLRLPFVPERVSLVQASLQTSPSTVSPAYRVSGDTIIFEDGYGDDWVDIQIWPETSTN